MNKLFSKSNQEKGQGLVEYAIIIALVAIVVIGALRVLGPRTGDTFSMINNSLDSVVTSSENSSNPAPTAAPTMTYQQWCASLGFPYHLNGSGVCVKTN